jgi:phage repressor protein C with HTH and peptisase S24 domain
MKKTEDYKKYDKEFGDRLQYLIQQKKIPLNKISEEIGVTGTLIYDYKKGKKSLSAYRINKIIDALNLSSDEIYYLFQDGKKPKNINTVSGLLESQANDLNLDKSKYQTIPVYSFAGAGKFINLTEIEPIDTLLVPKEFIRKKLAVVKVIGTSMEPFIKDGSYVGIDLSYRELVSGYIYCVNLDYEGALIKYVIKNREGITLKSENPKFDDIFIKKEEIADVDHFVIGRVVWVWQNL